MGLFEEFEASFDPALESAAFDGFDDLLMFHLLSWCPCNWCRWTSPYKWAPTLPEDAIHNVSGLNGPAPPSFMSYIRRDKRQARETEALPCGSQQ